MSTFLRATLALLVIGLAWLFGGGGGVLTLALYIIGIAPGIPFGFALFGRTHAAGWVSGALIGYGLLALGWWIPVLVGRPAPWTFAAAWLMLVLLGRAATRTVERPLIPLPPWTVRDSAALLLVLHLVPVLIGSPFARTGERDGGGTRYYRAYFTADFVWHMALTREVARMERHLRNPYVSAEDLHYYWTYFVPPAVIAARGNPNPGADVEPALKVHAMMTALLLLAMVFLAASAAAGRRWAAVLATLIALMAASFEGLYALYDLRRNALPWSAVRELNIDAVVRWVPQIGGLRVDNLPRTMWWTPQHGASAALGLIAMLAASRWSAVNWRGALVLGLALALSVTFNPLLGGVFCVVYGLTAAWDVASKRMSLAGLASAAVAVLPVSAALVWGLATGMSEGADALTFGLHEFARTAPLTALSLSLGGVLVPAALGLVPSRHVAFRPAVPGMLALAAGLLLMHFVTLTDTSWVGFRAGNVILVTVGMLIARGLVVVDHVTGRTAAILLAAVMLLLGSATTAIDWFNARDVENRAMGPGFLWVMPISSEQQAAYDWLRRATPPGAVVQADPFVRGRQNWSGIPSFGGRRMAAAAPLSLLPNPSHEQLVHRAHQIFTALPADEARAAATELGIDYLWLDRDDWLAPGGASLQRLLDRPDLFPPMFTAGDTHILAVAK